MNKIKSIFNELMARSEAKRENKRISNLQNISQEILQVLEFNGELFVCYKNVPIVSCKQLKSGLPDTLSESRKTWVEWRKKCEA